MQDAREILEAMQERVLAWIARLEPEKHNLTADQKLYEKMTASIQGT